MKYKLEFLILGFLLFSCGGGGPAKENLGISSVSKSYIQQDVICCSNYDSDTEVCKDYNIPQPESFEVTITNEQLTGNSEPIQVNGCTAYFYPKNGAPELTEGYQYVTCTPTIIKPGESKNIVVTLQAPLIEIMNEYYYNLNKTLSYRVKITFDISGYYTGKDYNVIDYVDIDFGNFIKNLNDMCQGG